MNTIKKLLLSTVATASALIHSNATSFDTFFQQVKSIPNARAFDLTDNDSIKQQNHGIKYIKTVSTDNVCDSTRHLITTAAKPLKDMLATRIEEDDEQTTIYIKQDSTSAQLLIIIFDDNDAQIVLMGGNYDSLLGSVKIGNHKLKDIR